MYRHFHTVLFSDDESSKYFQDKRFSYLISGVYFHNKLEDLMGSDFVRANIPPSDFPSGISMFMLNDFTSVIGFIYKSKIGGALKGYVVLPSDTLGILEALELFDTNEKFAYI